MKAIRIVDTTLRDGEQSPGFVLSAQEKIEIAEALSDAGVYQIEVGTPAMGAREKNTISGIIERGLKSKIATWNRMIIEDIKDSVQCGPDMIHICVPASNIHIKHKLNRDPYWVLQNMKRCIAYAKEKGFEVVIGLEDASRAEVSFLEQVVQAAKREGVNRIRYADTVGILHRKKIHEDLKVLMACAEVDFEIHAHNDLGMAVSNSIAAVNAGARYVNTTIAGIGERAGNCNFSEFILSAKTQFDLQNPCNAHKLWKLEEKILRKMKISNRDIDQYTRMRG